LEQEGIWVGRTINRYARDELGMSERWCLMSQTIHICTPETKKIKRPHKIVPSPKRGHALPKIPTINTQVRAYKLA